MPATAEEALAGGLTRDGRRHRKAVLRGLEAAEERTLLDELTDALPAERITSLLTASVKSIGELAPIGAEDIRALAIGDRDRLVLALRRLLHGEQLECTLTCSCGERLELSFDVAALLGSSEVNMLADDATATTAGGAEIHVRPATGKDHERAARRALEDPAAAGRELVQGCILEARDAAGRAAPVDTADDEMLAAAEALLAELDPGADVVLDGCCPECGERVAATFDPITHLWAELEQDRTRLELEVHILALHYHWSEEEIVALPPARRARYLAQLDHYVAGR